MRHGLFMIGGIIRIDGHVREKFRICCDVFAEDEFSPDATAKHGYTSEMIRGFQDPYDAYQQLIGFLSKHVDKYDKADKFHFIGYGAEYDNKFLRRFFESNGDEYFGSWFWHPWIDVMSLAAEFLKAIRHKMPNFQLETVAKQMGVDITKVLEVLIIKDGKPHDALFDAGLTMLTYDTLTKAKIIDQSPVSPNPVTMPDGTLRYKLDSSGAEGRKRKF